ncbi:MAG TPA: hypothetical protein VGM32_19615 [Rhodopila sp.]|jgi:hypothetical protein
MNRWLPVLLLLLATATAPAEPALRLELTGPPVPAIADARPGCDADDIPDAPARAIRTASGDTLLFATHFRNRVEHGPDLLHVRHRCQIVMRGAENDDPAAYDDRAWVASLWTPDGVTVYAVIHNEFQGHRRPALCPTGRYMDCWFNALTAAVSHDEGMTFHRMPSPALVAELPYRYDQVGLGHHGYFNPSNIVTLADTHYMFAFATRTQAQREGNCLLRTTAIQSPETWRAWAGSGFDVAFLNPYRQTVSPEAHVCAPVDPAVLRWPVTSLVRHQPSGLFIATMQDTGRGGGVYYATSPDLLTWTGPARLVSAFGGGGWTCGDPPPIAYPSLLDPASQDRNFETVGDSALLFVTRLNIKYCTISMDRQLMRRNLRIISP